MQLNHIDANDYKNGLCFVIPFGNWIIGGQLIFPDINLEVELSSGDLICFQSHSLSHFVNDFEGERNSIVLFCDNNLFFS